MRSLSDATHEHCSPRAPYRTGPTLLSPPQRGSTSAWTAGTISVVTVSTWRTILQAGAQQRYKLHVYCTCKPAYKCCTCTHAAYTATVKLITNTVCVNALLQRLCAEREGSLASAHSALEYHYLQRLAQKGGHTFAWLGGYNFLVSSHACTHALVHTCTCAHARTHTHTNTHKNAHKQTHTRKHTYRQTHTCTHTYNHT